MNKDNVIKSYGKDDGKNPYIVRVSQGIQDIIIDAKKNKVSIHTIRIIVSILAKIKHDQLEKPHQLDLFYNEFLKEADSLIKFTVSYTTLLPENYTSIKPLKDSFDFLVNYENEYHEIVNGNGQNMEIGGGIVIGKPNWNHSRKTVTFHMNSYWYHAFLNINPSFNTHLLSIFFKTSSVNSAVFYSWLTTLPTGASQPSLNWFNNKFATNYKSYSDLDRYLLKNLKSDIDKWGDISFGYSKDTKNKNRVNVRRFDKGLPELKENKKQDIEYSKIKYKMTYLKGKHGLNKEQVVMLRTVFQKYGYEKMNRLFTLNKKSWTEEVKGDELVKRFTAAYTAYLKKIGNSF